MAGRKTKGMDVEAVKAKYKKAGMPGAPHKILSRMAGTWNAGIKSWLDPGAPPMEFTGISDQEMIFEGRFLKQDFKSEMMGETFEGIGFTGYDNQTKKFVSVWLESSGTSIMFLEGRASRDGRRITQEGCGIDPVKGPMVWKSVTRFVNGKTHVFALYSIDRKKTEQKMLEITYVLKA